MNYRKRLTKPVVLVPFFVLFCLSAWALSVPSVKAQNYVDIWSDHPICWGIKAEYNNVGWRECTKPEDNPGTVQLQYRLRLTQTSARPGDKIGIVTEFSVSWQYSCPTEVWSCDDVQRYLINFLSAFSNRVLETGTIFGAPDPNGSFEVSIDTGGLTAQPLVVNPDIVQSLGLRPADTASSNFQKTGSSTTDFVIPAGVQLGTYQLKATYMWTPSAAAEAGASLGVPSTEPVSLQVNPGGLGTGPQPPSAGEGQNLGTVSGGGTPSVTSTLVTAGGGAAAGAAGIAAGLIASGLASRFGKADGEEEKGDDWKGPTDETTRTAIDEEAGRIVEDAILHGPKYAQDDFKTLVKAIQGEAVGLSASSAVPPPESAPEPGQQSSGDLIKQLQDSLRAEQDHMQGSPPESSTGVQQTSINLADPTQVQQALDGFNARVQSSEGLKNALTQYDGRRVTIQIDGENNQSTVLISQDGLSQSTPTDPKNDMVVKLTSDEIKQFRQDLADIRSGDFVDRNLAKADLGLRLGKKLADGTLKNVQSSDIERN